MILLFLKGGIIIILAIVIIYIITRVMSFAIIKSIQQTIFKHVKEENNKEGGKNVEIEKGK